MNKTEEPSKIYGKRKNDIEPVVGLLKAILAYTRFSLRGKERVENEFGFALLAVNFRKFTANISTTFFKDDNIRIKPDVIFLADNHIRFLLHI